MKYNEIMSGEYVLIKENFDFRIEHPRNQWNVEQEGWVIIRPQVGFIPKNEWDAISILQSIDMKVGPPLFDEEVKKIQQAGAIDRKFCSTLCEFDLVIGEFKGVTDFQKAMCIAGSKNWIEQKVN